METKSSIRMVRRSARLANRFQPERAAVQEAGEVPVVGSCVRPFTRSVAASTPLLGAPRRDVPGRVRDLRDGARTHCFSPRAVRIVLERLDPAIIDHYANRTKRDPEVPIIESAIRQVKIANEKTGRTHKPRRVTFAPDVVSPVRQIAQVGRSTGVRILQLNMRRSTVVTGEVRQLIKEKRLDILLLQEPYSQKRDKGHVVCGLGLGNQVAASKTDRPWAAVVVCNPGITLLLVAQLSTSHCVCAEVQAPGFSFYVVSSYFQFCDEIEGHLRHLEMVFRSLRGQRIIVAVDANARSSLWGPQRTDDRGAKLEDLIRAYGMTVVNDADQPPTYWTEGGSSYIDVTLASPRMNQFIGDWKVRCDWTTSDHSSVDIRLRMPKVAGNDQGVASGRFDINRADWERFAESLADLSRSRLEVLDLNSAADINCMADELGRVLRDASESSMPRKRKFRKSNPWWTNLLTSLKKGVYRNRRALQGERDVSVRPAMKLIYRDSLREYSRAVKRAKTASWRKFVTSHGNSEPWGFVYKHQAGKLRAEGVLSTLRRGDDSTKSLEETASYLLQAHTPDDREDEDTLAQRGIREGSRSEPSTSDAPVFKGEEMVAAVKTFKCRKAPGPDLIEVAVLKAAVRLIPGQLLRLYNGCLQWGVFPSVWKVGSLRVLLKGEDKDVENPKSYRPICLLSVVGKLFEKLIKCRLAASSLSRGRISDRQYGFMPGRSTEDAVVELRRMVSASQQRYVIALLFDISGAFDNVWWPLVLGAFKDRLCERNIFRVLVNYFEGREMQIACGSLVVSKQVSRGCPQGSVLGPTCWNVMFDGLLKKLESLIGNKFVAYADDLVVVIEGNSRRELETEGQRVTNEIEKWCREAKLEISVKKTEGIILKSVAIKREPIGRRGGARPDRKRKNTRAKMPDVTNRPPTIRLGETKIAFKKSVRYLGVHFDKGMGVRTHVEYLSGKVGSLFNKLGRLARCRWGLRFGALSAIYRGVFAPTVAYAAAGWADLCAGGDLGVLRSLQRRVLISTTSAYRTASWESLCVVAGAVPVDILLQEFRARYTIRKGESIHFGNTEILADQGKKVGYASIREAGINLWQGKWTSSVKGRTTFAFFPKVQDRLGARWLEPDHYCTQVFTGHGDFRERLSSLGLADDDDCGCGGGVDSVAHLLLECREYDPQRVALRSMVPGDQWRWPQVARFVASTPEVFTVFRDFCREALWIRGLDRQYSVRRV